MNTDDLAAFHASQPRTRPDDGIVDEVAVRRAIEGEQVGPLTREERAQAVRLMYRRGTSWEDISERLGVSHYTIGRLLGGQERRRRKESA